MSGLISAAGGGCFCRRRIITSNAEPPLKGSFPVAIS